MAKHIGIVAVSGEGAALCYRTIVTAGPELMGENDHPEITMHTFPLRRFMEFASADRWEEVGKLMLESAKKCAKAGADFLICPANTAHQGLDLVRKRSKLPWLHIVEEVAAVAEVNGYKRTAVLGTRFLMEGPVYPERLAERGIEHVIPEPAEREEIDRIIFGELIHGRLHQDSRDYVCRLIDEMGARGCDSVAMACTEIPLLVTQEDVSLPVLDSTRILAHAALRHAVGEHLAARA